MILYLRFINSKTSEITILIMLLFQNQELTWIKPISQITYTELYGKIAHFLNSLFEEKVSWN